MTVRSGRGASFTAELLAELTPHTPPLACCRAAMVEGMTLAGHADAGDLATVRLSSARAALKALHENQVGAHVERVPTARRASYRVVVDPTAATASVRAGDRPCCARSLLRGAFLAAGTVARPDGVPHLEIPCRSAAAAHRIGGLFAGLAIQARVVERRGRPVVVVRSTEGVAAALSTIGAQSGRLRFEDGRVVRELRGGVNRRLNAETANLRRVVGAGMEQLSAIRALRADRHRWNGLPPALREAALLRERHPQDSLEHLARRVGCSRSAMADRLRRIVAAAEVLSA